MMALKEGAPDSRFTRPRATMNMKVRGKSERHTSCCVEEVDVATFSLPFPMPGEVLDNIIVSPACGDVVLFYHAGLYSPWHAGMPVTGLSSSLGDARGKYVLRSDVFCEVDPASVSSLLHPLARLPISPPYNAIGCKYTSMFSGEDVAYEGYVSD